jgi:hypothetical protein
MDILRPSKKENTIGNMRPARTPSPEEHLYVFNPADRPQPTIRDTEKGNPYLNVNSNQRGGGYETRSVKLGATSATAPRTLLYWQRSGGEGRQPRPYDAEYSQKNNDKVGGH